MSTPPPQFFDARKVPCPYCGARIGQRCRRGLGKDRITSAHVKPFRGRPVDYIHIQRFHEAARPL